jgi:hypothetical protein
MSAFLSSASYISVDRPWDAFSSYKHLIPPQAGMTSRQGMLTHPTHLIPLLTGCGQSTGDAYSSYALDPTSDRVWPVDRRCLLLLGTWSHFLQGVTNRQRMLTPPRHLIPPLMCTRTRNCPTLDSVLFYRIYETDHFSWPSPFYHPYGVDVSICYNMVCVWLFFLNWIQE